MQIKKQQLEPDIQQGNGSKLEKECIKAIYCHPTYLTFMQNTSYKIQVWMKHKLEPRMQGEISMTSDTQMTTTLMTESKEKLNNILMKMKEREKKSQLKTQHSKN